MTKKQLEAAAQLMERMSFRQIADLQEAAGSGDIDECFLSIIGDIAQDVHEDAAAQDVLKDIKSKLDPYSVNFSAEAYKAAIMKAGGFDAVGKYMGGKLGVITGISPAGKDIDTLFLSDAYKAIYENMKAVNSIVDTYKEYLAPIMQLGHDVQELLPYIRLELEADPALADLTLSDILKSEIDENGNPTDSQLKQLIKRARIRQREHEKTQAAEQARTAPKTAPLAPLESVPNADILNFLFCVLSSGRKIESNPKNRHVRISSQISKDQAHLRFEKTNKAKNSTLIVEVSQADNYFKKTNKGFLKILMFALQKMTAQNFPLKVGFSLQELVDLGIYSNTSNARRAVRDFMQQSFATILRGTVKKGKEVIREEGGPLFYHYEIQNGYVILSVNENFNIKLLTTYFSVFPRFAYALSNNAFSLVRYIFFVARQNTKAIKEKSKFNISMDAIRENLGLLPANEVKNRKYKQFIIDPIEKAIEETEEAIRKAPEAQRYDFTITPYMKHENTTNINEWLEGYIEVSLNGDFARIFVQLATNTEKRIEKMERAKQTQLARLAAKETIKEAKKEG